MKENDIIGLIGGICMDEKEKMKLGMWYDANHDEDIVEERLIAQDLCFQLNQIRPIEEQKRKIILHELLHDEPQGLVLLSPFQCDYGKNIHFGHDVFVNMNCYFMDGASISIGNHVFIGPYCGLYTASHPIDYQRRNQGLEKASPIVIKDHCWLGANVSVMPGVTIGKGCVIAAGSVVTHDIPDFTLAAGVPCRVIKKIDGGGESHVL